MGVYVPKRGANVALAATPVSTLASAIAARPAARVAASVARVEP